MLYPYSHVIAESRDRMRGGGCVCGVACGRGGASKITGSDASSCGRHWRERKREGGEGEGAEAKKGKEIWGDIERNGGSLKGELQGAAGDDGV